MPSTYPHSSLSLSILLSSVLSTSLFLSQSFLYLDLSFSLSAFLSLSLSFDSLPSFQKQWRTPLPFIFLSLFRASFYLLLLSSLRLEDLLRLRVVPYAKRARCFFNWQSLGMQGGNQHRPWRANIVLFRIFMPNFPVELDIPNAFSMGV